MGKKRDRKPFKQAPRGGELSKPSTDVKKGGKLKKKGEMGRTARATLGVRGGGRGKRRGGIQLKKCRNSCMTGIRVKFGKGGERG